MKEEIRALVDTVASRRVTLLKKQYPSSDIRYTMDQDVPRAAVTVILDGHPAWMEFIESRDTAGKEDMLDDYIFCAQQFNMVVLLFPEDGFPTRDFAHTVMNDIFQKVKAVTNEDIKFSGYLYDSVATFKKVM